MKRSRPGAAIPAGIRKVLIAFAGLRRHNEVVVLRKYRQAPAATQAAMVAEMRHQLAAAVEREHTIACVLPWDHEGKCSGKLPEPPAEFGAPGAGRLDRIMGEERTGRIVDVHLDGRAVVRCDDDGELITGRVVTDPGLQLVAHIPEDDDPYVDDVNHS